MKKKMLTLLLVVVLFTGIVIPTVSASGASDDSAVTPQASLRYYVCLGERVRYNVTCPYTILCTPSALKSYMDVYDYTTGKLLYHKVNPHYCLRYEHSAFCSHHDEIEDICPCPYLQ